MDIRQTGEFRHRLSRKNMNENIDALKYAT